jgi:hypothetical protein
MDEQAPGSTAAADPIRAVRGTEQVQGPLGSRSGRSRHHQEGGMDTEGKGGQARR